MSFLRRGGELRVRNLTSVPTEAGTCHVHIRNIPLGFLALISVCTLELGHRDGLSRPRHFSRLSASLPLGACVTAAGSIGRGLPGGKPLFWGDQQPQAASGEDSWWLGGCSGPWQDTEFLGTNRSVSFQHAPIRGHQTVVHGWV